MIIMFNNYLYFLNIVLVYFSDSLGIYINKNVFVLYFRKCYLIKINGDVIKFGNF